MPIDEMSTTFNFEDSPSLEKAAADETAGASAFKDFVATRETQLQQVEGSLPNPTDEQNNFIDKMHTLFAYCENFEAGDRSSDVTTPIHSWLLMEWKDLNAQFTKRAEEIYGDKVATNLAEHQIEDPQLQKLNTDIEKLNSAFTWFQKQEHPEEAYVPNEIVVEAPKANERLGAAEFTHIITVERSTFENFVKPYPEQQADDYAHDLYGVPFSELRDDEKTNVTNGVHQYAENMSTILERCDQFVDGNRSKEVVQSVESWLVEKFHETRSLLEQRAKTLYGDDKALAFKDKTDEQLNNIRESVQETLRALNWVTIEAGRREKAESAE